MAATQEIIDWLGDFASTVSDEQIDAIAEAATTIERRARADGRPHPGSVSPG